MFSPRCLAAVPINGNPRGTFVCRCYECGEFGHLSYACPNNLLGDREPPKKKSKKRKKETTELKTKKFCKSEDADEEADEDEENFEDESLSAAIRYQVGLCFTF